MEELSPSKHFRYTVVELYKSLTFSLRASGEVHFTGSFIPSDFCSTSLVRPKSDTFAMLSSDISTFRAARSLRDQRQKQHSLVTVVLTRTVFSLSLSLNPPYLCIKFCDSRYTIPLQTFLAKSSLFCFEMTALPLDLR